jgi:flagellar motor switch protein FliG
MRRVSLLILSACATILAFCPTQARAQSQMDEKLRLEAQMAHEVSTILDQFIGPGKSHVTVNLGISVKRVNEAMREEAEAKKEQGGRSPNKKDGGKPNVQTKWLWQDAAGKAKRTVLPGFAIAPQMTVTDDAKSEKIKEPELKEPEKKSDAKDGDSAVYMMEVTRTVVSVVIDNSVPEKNVKMVEVMISEVLGLDPDRGDKLNVYTLPLLPSWQRMLYAPDSMGVIARLAAWVVVGALFVWLLTRSVIAVLRSFGLLPFKKQLDIVKSGGEDKEKGKDSAEKEKKIEGKAGEKTEDPDPKAAPTPRYFDFVNKDNAGFLAELLENCEPQEAANVVGFLEPAVATLVLNSLKLEKRASILWCLSWAKSLTPEVHEMIRAQWRDRLEHAFGGSDSVGNLLSDMDTQHQTWFISKMAETSPELANKIKRSVLRFENLFVIEDKDLTVLAQTFSFQEWAVALSGFPSAYTERLMRVLPQPSKPALQQWLNLTPANAPEGPQTRLKLTKLARAMALEGKISLEPAKTAAVQTVPPATFS